MEWPPMDYLIFQKEKGKKNTIHLQGYVEFTKQTRVTALKKITFGKSMHWEKRRGTRPEAREYCMKDDETKLEDPLEYGRWVPGDNAPNKFLQIRNDLAAGASELDIATNYPDEYVKYQRGINKLVVIEVLS